MKYKKLTGIILKKQNYGEADQIISLWTREAGKVRVLAKSLRKNSSKLAFACQDLSIVEINIVGNTLPTLIGAKPLQHFRNFALDLKKTANAFYAAELMMKITADEHPNEFAYDLLANFFTDLDQSSSSNFDSLLNSFCLNLLDNMGFKIPEEKQVVDHSTINKFIEYIIEHNIKSEPFLISI